jgi:hypothetical protein
MPLHRDRRATRSAGKSGPPALRVVHQSALEGVAGIARAIARAAPCSYPALFAERSRCANMVGLGSRPRTGDHSKTIEIFSVREQSQSSCVSLPATGSLLPPYPARWPILSNPRRNMRRGIFLCEGRLRLMLARAGHFLLGRCADSNFALFAIVLHRL